MMSFARDSNVDNLFPYVARSPFVHINSFSRILQNRTWPACEPAAWMTDSHMYPPYCLYRAPEVQDRITLNIQRWKVDELAMKHLSIHDNLPRTHVLYLDGVIINSKTTEFVDTHSPLPEHNGPIHYTKCWYKLLQLSHVTTYPKIENWNESIVVFFKCTTYPKNLKLKWDDYVNIFSMQLNNAFSYLVSFFGMELTFPPSNFPSNPVPLGVMLNAQPYF